MRVLSAPLLRSEFKIIISVSFKQIKYSFKTKEKINVADEKS